METYTIQEWVAAYRNQEPVEAFGFTWQVARISYRTLQRLIDGGDGSRGSVKIPVAIIELRSDAHPDIEDLVPPYAARIVVETHDYAPIIEESASHLAHVKQEASRQARIQPGHAYRYLIDNLRENPETAEHEAIERGRELLRGGKLESTEAMVEFIESIE